VVPHKERTAARHHRGGIRSAQHEVLLDAAKLALSGEPIEIARELRERAEQTIRPKGKA
jgi:hypothetical protein